MGSIRKSKICRGGCVVQDEPIVRKPRIESSDAVYHVINWARFYQEREASYPQAKRLKSLTYDPISPSPLLGEEAAKQRAKGKA